MGNTTEGTQQGKEPGNEPPVASGGSQNVDLTSNEVTSQVSSGIAVDISCDGDGSISSGGVENVVEQSERELEGAVEADLETDGKPDYLDDGLNVAVVKSHRDDADEGIVNGSVFEAGGDVQGPVLRRQGTSTKTLSNSDEEVDKEFPKMVESVGSDGTVFANSEKTWRDSIASTMTDVSEMYQTAGEDSDNEVGDNDDDDDELRKTLCEEELRETIADVMSTGYGSMIGDEIEREMWEKGPHVELGDLVETEEMAYMKGLLIKPVLNVNNECGDVETGKMEDTSVPRYDSSKASEEIAEEIGIAVGEYVAADSRRDIGDDGGHVDDVDGKLDDGVKGFDIDRNQTDPQDSAVNDLIDFGGKDYIDASNPNDAIVVMRVSSVSLQLKSPVPNESQKSVTMDAGHIGAISQNEQSFDDQESLAENDIVPYTEPETTETESSEAETCETDFSETETCETGTETVYETEDTFSVSLTEVSDDEAEYNVTDIKGDDDDISEHGASPRFDAYSSSAHIVLVSNTEGNVHQSGSSETRELNEDQVGHLEGSDVATTRDETVCVKEGMAENARLVEGISLGFGNDSSEQKDVDAIRSHTPDFFKGTERSIPLDEDASTSISHSQEHEQDSSTLPANNDEFSDTLPAVYESPFESKSFISQTQEQQEPRTMTMYDEERTDIEFASGHRINSSSTRVKSDESEEEEDAGRVPDRRSVSLVSTTTVEDDDEAEAAGGTAESQSWSGGEEEPDPDYSLSSDDDAAYEARPDMKDLIGFEMSTATRSGDSEDREDAPTPDYAVNLSELRSEMPDSSSSSTDPISGADVNGQGAEQTPDDNRTDDFDLWDDDGDDTVPLGNFQRMSSIRPSKRGRIKSKRSPVAIPPSWSEHPEEEGDVSSDTPGAESVFHSLSAEALTIPNPARYDRGPLSVPVLAKNQEQELWTRATQDSSTRATTGRDKENQSHRRGLLGRRNATRSTKTEGSSDEREWTKYEVVLRKSQEGFGITLSNSSPVVVHRVQEDGVAFKNGIREGDRIHKVNGSLVSSCSHEEVINSIKSSGLFIVLVLLRPSAEVRDQPVPITPSITENMRLSRQPKSMSITSVKSVGGVSLISSRMSSPPETPDTSYDAVPKPFTDLNLLKQKPAHLAVFLNYLLTEGKPNTMLFTLIADCYQSSFKESNNSARRWAYEIYSTFLMSSAPLKLSVDDKMEASVEKILQKAATNGLFSMFVPITKLVRNDILCQLRQFVLAWKSERNNYASDYYNLRTMNLERTFEFQMVEGALWKHFEHCLSEERNDANHAVAYSLATFFRQIGYSGAKNSNLLENCPTFMSKDKKALKNKMKKHFAHKGHQFSPRQFAAVTLCQLCQKVIWGLGHQAYHCSSCDLSIHRHCTEKIIDVCGRNKDSKRSVRDMIPGRRPQNSVKEDFQKNLFLPLFMTDTDDPRNMPMTPVDRSNGPEHERLHLPEFTTHLSGRSPSRSYSRQFCISDDSDLEVDSELPQLADFIPKEELRQMKEKEKKRQQIINELFHTERLHSRALKVMDKVFFRPMQDESYIDQDFVSILFPNLHDLIQIHDSLKKSFVALRKEKTVVDEVGLLLISWFSGSLGHSFKAACAKFCADQAYALDVLRAKQKKDPRFSAFLQEAAANSLCKRQELKDLLPRQMQRLTKYPLLIDSLRKNTSANTEEHGHLTRALEMSKSLLVHVNQVVRSVQNQRHLADMQQRLDWRSGDASSLGEYRFLNLTKHVLVYDGEVTWRPYQSRPIELHMVLFEDILVLLQKQDDRLVLRCQTTTVEDRKFPYCPVLKLNSLMIRDVATDKCAFFVVDSVSPQVYDLLAHCREEKNKWCNHITETIKRYTGVHGPFKGNRARSATQVIDLVSYSKSERGPGLADLPANQASEARSVSCHVMKTYDSPDQSAAETNVQQVVSHLANAEESVDATNLSNTDECDNTVKYDNRDDCGNIVEAPRAFELERRLMELTLCINRLMREKMKLASEDANVSFGEEDSSFQGSETHALDAKELVRSALTCVNNLMDLINDQMGSTASSSGSSLHTEDAKLSIPAEDLLNFSANLQHLTAQLATRVTTDDAELERLEEDFRVALDDLKEKSSAIQTAPPGDQHPDDSKDGLICTNFGASDPENAFFPTATSQENIYTVFDGNQLTYYDDHHESNNANSDLPTEEDETVGSVDED